MWLNRVMIAAPKSGSGKTTITCALLQALKDAGKQVVAYKCGPDYIDPMFHQKVIDIPAKNLDTFFTGEEETKTLFLKNRKAEEFAVLEGVMGLFDGLGGIREEGSSYHLAKVTKTPIILVVDAKGMGRSIIPLISGFLSYDTEHLIKGVILNRMSKAYYEIMKALIEEELAIQVLGYFPEDKDIKIESRHLGLLMPNDLSDVKEQLQKAAEGLQRTVSLEKIIQLAEEAEALGDREGSVEKTENLWAKRKHGRECVSVIDKAEFPVLAVARDEAFCFYYEDNLCLLQECGARIEYFSPMYDTKLPEGCSGILLGGGYPELFGEALSSNTQMLSAIRKAIADGMPVVAECGGFMYLHSSIEDKEGKRYNMVGTIPAACHYTGKLVRFGYMELSEKQSTFLPEGERIKGHEFHYFDSEENGSDCVATKPTTGRSYVCIHSDKNCWMGFPHLYYPSNPAFAGNFVEKVKAYKERKGK